MKLFGRFIQMLSELLTVALLITSQIVSMPFCFGTVNEETYIRQPNLLSNKSLKSQQQQRKFAVGFDVAVTAYFAEMRTISLCSLFF